MKETISRPKIKKTPIDKNRKLNKTIRLKKRRKKIIRITTLTCILLSISLGCFLIKKAYISYKCTNLTYAVDHYFTNWKNKDLRLNGVQTMALLEKNDDTVKVEAYGLAYRQPHARTTLVGTFEKNSNGSWKMKDVEIKTPTN